MAGDYRKTESWNSVAVPAKVAIRAYSKVEEVDGCWISLYSVGSHGYAQIGWQEAGERNMVLAHRAAWVYMNGQLPLGMTLDHLCKVKRCVNPEHLRMLPNYENARWTNGRNWPMGQCANGHPNTMRIPRVAFDKRGKQRVSTICAACRKVYIARSNWRMRHPSEELPRRLLLVSERQHA